MRQPFPIGESYRLRAFSLIEVMLALVLIALAATALVELIDSANRLGHTGDSGKSGQRALAQLAEEVLEEALEGEWNSGTVSNHPYWGDVRWQLSPIAGAVGGGVSSVGELELFELSLEVDGEEPYRLETLRWYGGSPLP